MDELEQEDLDLLVIVLRDCFKPLQDAGKVTLAEADERARNMAMALQGAFTMAPIPEGD
jgi:hypothetical protein